MHTDSNSNSNNNDILFFKIWRNIYINKQLFYHLSVFNKVFKFCEQGNLLCNWSFSYFKYPEYILEFNYYRNVYKICNDEELETIYYSSGLFDDGLKKCKDSKGKQLVIPSLVEKVIYHSDDPMVIGFIPGNSIVKKLEFNSEFDSPLEIGVIPFGIEQVSFDIFSYSHVIKPGYLPNSITSLKFGKYCFKLNNSIDDKDSGDENDQDDEINEEILVKGTIPDSVLYLDMGNFNEQLLPNLLPCNLIELTFHSFNKPFIICDSVGQLSSLSSLTYLDMGNEFNSRISITTLIGLKELKFGDSFHGDALDFNALPISITSLEFGYGFTKHLPNTILSHLINLKSITLTKDYTTSIESNDILKIIQIKKQQFNNNYGGI